MKALISFIMLFSLQALAEHQLALLGLTLHAGSADKGAQVLMKNKIDENGWLAYNPEINYSFIDQNEVIYQAAFLQDCFKHPAIILAYGKRYEVSKDLYLGIEAGVYARQVPHDDTQDMNRFMRYGIYQIIPTPGFLAQYNMTEHLVFRVQSNVLLNFFDIAFKF